MLWRRVRFMTIRCICGNVDRKGGKEARKEGGRRLLFQLCVYCRLH